MLPELLRASEGTLNDLVPAVFAVVSTNPHWARVVAYGPFSLFAIHKEDLCPSSRDIIRLMMMMMKHFRKTWMDVDGRGRG
jgi:hypothetical protein